MASMVEARKTSHHQAKSTDHSSHHKKSKGSKSSKSSPGHGRHAPAPSPSVGPHGSRIFDVVSFGAIGDGVSDDSKVSELFNATNATWVLQNFIHHSFCEPFLQALEAAWDAACKVTSATIEIPSEFKFLVNPLTLQGPCMPGLVLHVCTL